MPTIAELCKFLESEAPLRLAEAWDNVGLLVGDPAAPASRIMTCLTITPESAAEAIADRADMIVTHHPLPFQPLKRLTTETTGSRLLWDLIRSGVSIYSPHTGFDSARSGINQQLGQRFGMNHLVPLIVDPEDPEGLGSGRIGNLPEPIALGRLIEQARELFGLPTLQIVGELTSQVRRIAFACGSGGSFLEPARLADCDTLITGETNFHNALQAKACGISLVLLGHYSSERFAVENLATRIADTFSAVDVWASRKESDPLMWA